MSRVERVRLNEFSELVHNLKKLPACTILLGRKGSQRISWAYYLGECFDCNVVVVDGKIDSIREIIDLAYQQTSPMLYVIPNAEKISVGAKNALLKVTEEPPQQAHFCLILDQLEGFLPTLISRSVVLNMGTYKPEDLQSYAADFKIPPFVETPGEVDEVKSYDMQSFEDVVNKMVLYLKEAGKANALKIGLNLKYKEVDNSALWDPELFMRAFMNSFAEYWIKQQPVMVRKVQRVTSHAINDLHINGINKRAVVDSWILDIHVLVSTDGLVRSDKYGYC